MTWLQLARQTAIVTGAASGIGAAVAKALLAEQCRVVLADSDVLAMQRTWEEEDKTTVSSSNEPNKNIRMVQCNVTDPHQVQSLIQQADDFAWPEQGPAAASLLVNCAGITRDNWISKMSLEEWDRVVDVNLKGTFLTCRYFLDQERILRLTSNTSPLSPSPSLAIVNIGSIVSEQGNVGQVNYAASKGGVVGLTRALAKEMASRRQPKQQHPQPQPPQTSSSSSSLPPLLKIRVNAVIPGFIDTPMTQAVPDTVQQGVILPKIPMGRFGTVDEVANVVSFLLSPRSSYITGECIRVSGMMAL